jgi:hypothetical protein
MAMEGFDRAVALAQEPAIELRRLETLREDPSAEAAAIHRKGIEALTAAYPDWLPPRLIYASLLSEEGFDRWAAEERDRLLQEAPEVPALLRAAISDSEKLLRLPRSQWCYRPHPQAPAVSPLPALASGGIMFGSFNRLAKLNEGLLAQWGRLLADEPAFALTIATLMDEGNVARVHATLRAHGAREGQVRVLGDLDDTRFRNIRSGIDIALDSHPYNGTTTTCEALWVGLPVVTLAGGHGAARNSASLLHAITTKLWPLGDDVAFVPGHGPMSTFGRERQTNPFVSDEALAED